jgi:hypothetical protein
MGAASLSFLSERFRWLAILGNQLRVGQPLPGDRRAHLMEPTAVIVLALIKPEDLLVQIPAQMRRVNADVGSLEGPFQEAPEILDIVGMDMAAHELNRVVNGLMRVVGREAEIRFQGVCVDVRAGLDRRADFRCEGPALHIGHVRGFDPARSLFACALDDTEDSFLPRAASSFDLPLSDVPMHVLGEPPMKVSSASTSPLIFRNDPVCIASRMR